MPTSSPSGKLTIEELSPKVYHVRAESQYEITSTFMRLQEYYESPYSSIYNKYFTHEQYMDTCAHGTSRSAQEDIVFTYFDDWAGFNVPGNVFNRWVKKFSQHYLWEKEQQLIDLVYDQLENKRSRFYVIGSYDDSEDGPRVIDHELSHAWFYLDRKYKKKMLELVGKLSKSTYDTLKKSIMDEGYRESVIDDEIQAYLATNPMVTTKDMFPKGYNIPWDLVLEFQSVFHAAKEEKVLDDD